MRNMSVKEYFDKIIPYLRWLIDKNKEHEQKIQLDMVFNMVHINVELRILHVLIILFACLEVIEIKCFMYAITIALYYKKLGTNPERISKKLHAYSQKFNWHEIDFPACFVDYAIFQKLNEDIALNVLYIPFNEVNICPEYISKGNFTTKNQIILLKITDDSDE